MGELLEVAKAFVEPCEKLIVAVQNAIGKAYEPRHIKKLADAKAYEISTIGQAMRDNSDIPIVYEKGSIALDTTDFDHFVKRTEARLAYQELTKQRNIESVANQAYLLLEGCSPVENTPVDIDWLLRFFNSVQDISNVEMQRLWARTLAKEVLSPNTVSLRTLAILAQMTVVEARLFEFLSKYVLHCKNTPPSLPDDYFIFSDKVIQEMTKLTFPEIFQLDEMGVLSSNSFVRISFEVPPHTTEYISLQDKKVIEIKNNGDIPCEVSHSAYILTTAGRELLLAISEVPEPHDNLSEYLNLCKELLIGGEFTSGPLPPEVDVIVI